MSDIVDVPPLSTIETRAPVTAFPLTVTPWIGAPVWLPSTEKKELSQVPAVLFRNTMLVDACVLRFRLIIEGRVADLVKGVELGGDVAARDHAQAITPG